MTIWTTRADEQVSLGDLVALSVLKYADAGGRIVAEADEARFSACWYAGATAELATW